MRGRTWLAAGAGGAIGARALLVRAMLAKLRRDVDRLNAGDAGPLLDGYADDAVLVFNEGEHRWSGEHRGRPAIARFLRDFVTAGLRGEIGDLLVAGPPWALRMAARFDDRATGPGGEVLYANRVLIYARTRWGRIVRQEDFYEDTGRIEVLEQRLRELGVAPEGSAPGRPTPP
jgi:ketosteroid isomerase-like protein